MKYCQLFKYFVKKISGIDRDKFLLRNKFINEKSV